MSITPEQRAEWRESAEWHDSGHLDCDERILALLDALDEAEAKANAAEALAAKWMAFDDLGEGEDFIASRNWHGRVLDYVLRRAAVAGPAEERGDEA